MIANLNKNGFEVLNDLYSSEEIDEILLLLSSEKFENKFGVREFLLNNPEIREKVFTENLKKLINLISPNCRKSIKSIYFDKPPNANWIVNWHQDLTINLTSKKEIENFINWRVKQERVVVQPNLEMLESIFTIRIHLDDCTKKNGALRVMEGSHKNGVVPISSWMINKKGRETICEVQRGGVLVMKPLILHASRRTENQSNRRVIHIEFTAQELPEGLAWKELFSF